MPIDLNFQEIATKYMDTADYKSLMEERLQSIWKQAGLKIKYRQEQYKANYDKKAHDHQIKVGDLVYLNRPEPRKGMSPKLQRPFKGPYRVCGTTPTNLKLSH